MIFFFCLKGLSTAIITCNIYGECCFYGGKPASGTLFDIVKIALKKKLYIYGNQLLSFALSTDKKKFINFWIFEIFFQTLYKFK